VRSSMVQGLTCSYLLQGLTCSYLLHVGDNNCYVDTYVAREVCCRYGGGNLAHDFTFSRLLCNFKLAAEQLVANHAATPLLRSSCCCNP
jgi:hypothetical protein